MLFYFCIATAYYTEMSCLRALPVVNVTLYISTLNGLEIENKPKTSPLLQVIIIVICNSLGHFHSFG